MNHADRLADLERRLFALEERLALEKPSTAWAARAREDLAALANDQRELRDQLQSLLSVFLAWRDGAPLPPLQGVAPPPPPSPTWKRVAGNVLRLPGRLWRGFRAVARGGDWLLGVPRADLAPQVLELEDLVVLRLFGAPTIPPGLLELTRLVMALEDLQFVHLAGDPELLILRRSLGIQRLGDLPTQLGPALRRQRDGAPWGRAVEARVAAYAEPPASLRELRRVGNYWLPGSGGLRYPVAAAPIPRRAGAQGGVAVVLTTPLEGGLDALIAPFLLAALDREVAVSLVSLVDVRGGGPFWELGASLQGRGRVATMPLSSFFTPPLHPVALAQLLRQEGIERVLHVGPGQGFFDLAELPALLGSRPLFDVPVSLGGDLVPRPAGWVQQSFSLEARPAVVDVDSAATGLPATIPLTAPNLVDRFPDGSEEPRATRQRWLLPSEGPCWACVDQLVASARPEDFVELARRLPDHHFWWIGRGPLEGRFDDLVRYFGLTNLRRTPSVDLAEVLLAADGMVSTAATVLWPLTMVSAAQAGLPVFAAPNLHLAPWPNFRPHHDLAELTRHLQQEAQREPAREGAPERATPAESGSRLPPGNLPPWWQELLG